MNAIVRSRLLDDGQPRVIPLAAGCGMWIECEIASPRSAVGRHVNVYVPAGLVTGLMKELRETAIRARGKAMGQ